MSSSATLRSWVVARKGGAKAVGHTVVASAVAWSATGSSLNAWTGASASKVSLSSASSATNLSMVGCSSWTRLAKAA